MDELKEIRDLINSDTFSYSFQADLSFEEVKNLIEVRSRKHIIEFRRRLFLDFLVGTLVLVVTTYFLLTTLNLSEALIMIGLVIIPVFAVYIYIQQQTRRIRISGNNLKETLIEVKESIQGLQNVYLKTSTIGFPIIFFSTYFLIKITRDDLQFFTSSDLIIIIIGVLVSISLPHIIKKLFSTLTGVVLKEIKEDLEVLKEIS